MHHRLFVTLIFYDIIYIGLSIAILSAYSPCRYSYAKLITTIITTFSTCMLLFYIIKRLEDGIETESALKWQSTLLKIRTFISVIIGLPLLVYIILDQSCREYSYDLWLSSIISYIFDILSIAMHAAIINNL